MGELGDPLFFLNTVRVIIVPKRPLLSTYSLPIAACSFPAAGLSNYDLCVSCLRPYLIGGDRDFSGRLTYVVIRLSVK